jgi:hypothetical protein
VRKPSPTSIPRPAPSAQTANTRIHSTTGKRPVDLWPQEKLTTSIACYQLADLVSRQAGFDGFVRFERSRYSLPPDYAGQPLPHRPSRK